MPDWVETPEQRKASNEQHSTISRMSRALQRIADGDFVDHAEAVSIAREGLRDPNKPFEPEGNKGKRRSSQ